MEKPATAPVKRAGLLYAPQFDKTVPALAYFQLKNNWRSVSPPDYVTFGQAFAPGALAPVSTLAARYGETVLPAQLDVKALHDDGSVRHAAITAATPSIEPGATLNGALIAQTGLTPKIFDAEAIIAQAYDFPVALRFYDAKGQAYPFQTNAKRLLLTALQRDMAPWLDGPLTKEYRVETDATPLIRLRFDIRVYRDGDIRTSFAIVNHKSFAQGSRNAVYDAIIGKGEAPAFKALRIGHHRASNWRRVFWTGAQPKPHIVHDLEGLVRAAAALPLDPSLGIDAEAVYAHDRLLRDLPPLSPALIERDMPKPGGRADIGVYTQWAAHYLIAQTEAAKRVMLANADAAGAVPWHFIDDETGAPVSVEKRPRFWADLRGLERRYGADRPHADIFASSDGGWTPDHSHKPALSAVPYLVTADRYYADELAMQGAWAMFGRWPDFRDGGLKAIDVEQVRASAWSLRDLSDAAFLLPDAHPSKAYLVRALQQNLATIRAKYVERRAMRAAGELEGYFEEFVHGEPSRISPWQNDYMVLALWMAARRGETDAHALLRWTENFHVSRFLSPDFDKAFSAAYQLPAKYALTQKPVSDWGTLNDRIKAGIGVQDEGMQGYPSLGYGYLASAHAALSALVSANGSPAAYEALAELHRAYKSAGLWRENAAAGSRKHNQFLFAVATSDGKTITRSQIRHNRAGTAQEDFILGDDGNQRLDGAGGADMLFGFSGDDALNGGGGADYLNGGPGDNVLTGGPGADAFVFSKSGGGSDTVTDFNPSEDTLYLSADCFAPQDPLLPLHAQQPAGARIECRNNNRAVNLLHLSKEDLKDANIRKIQ